MVVAFTSLSPMVLFVVTVNMYSWYSFRSEMLYSYTATATVTPITFCGTVCKHHTI